MLEKSHYFHPYPDVLGDFLGDFGRIFGGGEDESQDSRDEEGFGNYPVVSQDVEDVAQEHEGAGGQAVQILGVGHLQCLPQKSPGKNGKNRDVTPPSSWENSLNIQD